MAKYRIEKGDPLEFKDHILSLLMRNLEEYSEDRYDWSYLKPEIKPLCLVAIENKTGNIVGTGAVFKRMVSFGGTILTAGVAGDFAVDKAHRILGPAITLQKRILSTMEEEDIRFIYTVPNKASGPIFKRLGYKKLSVYKRFVKILRAEYREGKSLLPSRLKTIASPLVDFGLSKLSRENRYSSPTGVTTDTIDSFTSSFDRLWANADVAIKTLGVRSSAFLNWRYIESNHQNYEIFVINTRESTPAGYIIFYILQNMAYIADMFFVKKDDTVDCLMAEFSLLMRKRGIGSISIHYVGGHFLEEKLRGLNFIEDRKETECIYVYTSGMDPEYNLLHDPGNWFFMEGDNDI